MAITKNPCDATSDKKLTCSHGELAHAPFPQAITGNLAFDPKTLKSFGQKMVWVSNELSVYIMALYLPVPPSSTTRGVRFIEPVSWLSVLFLINRTTNTAPAVDPGAAWNFTRIWVFP